MNVLYISYDGMTDPLGQSQVIPYLLKLSNAGYNITLLSCEKPDRYKTGKHIVENMLKNSFIIWETIFYTKKPPVLSTIYDYLKLKGKAEQLHTHKKFRLVHCRSYIPSMIGLWLKNKYGIKFIFDMRGFWADERVDGNLWNLKKPLYKIIYRFFKKQEKLFLENADHVISLTEKGKKEILKWKNITINPDSISVIPCCVDTKLFDPGSIKATKLQIKRELGIKDDTFVLCYLGSIGTWYLLDEMLEFFSELKKKIPDSKFLFLTLDEHQRIRNNAVLKGLLLDDIIIRPTKRSMVPTILSISDWSVFFIKPSYSKISSSPTKQGEIMAMGIPLICNNGIGDTDNIVMNYNSGLVINNFNYQEALLQMDTFNYQPSTIRMGALSYFSLNKGVGLYQDIYHALLQ